jgi:hypothetical protein
MLRSAVAAVHRLSSPVLPDLGGCLVLASRICVCDGSAAGLQMPLHFCWQAGCAVLSALSEVSALLELPRLLKQGCQLQALEDLDVIRCCCLEQSCNRT